MLTRSVLLAVIFGSLAIGCNQQDQAVLAHRGSEAPPVTATVSGTVTYRERMALGPGAIVEVSLQDISRADAAATVLARQEISGPVQVPARFSLEYSPADIDERMTYAVSARITDQGRLMFINDSVFPVLTRGAGNTADLVLVRVTDSSQPAAQTSGDLDGVALEGMFRYLADAALFRDCRTGKTYPVSNEGQYIEVESAYLNSGIEPGSEAMVTLRGRFLERPSMENNNNEIKLIVDVFNNLLPEKSCAPTVHAELIGTYWKLVELGGNKVTTAEGMREAHVILNPEQSGVKGFAGCNNFFGRFIASDEEALAFSAMGSTMMACPEGMDTEQGFLTALGSTTRYRISGLFLELYADDQLLARLEAVYL